MATLKLLLLAVVTSTVCGQNLMCEGNNLVGFNNGTDITKECQQSSNLTTCGMENVNQTIGFNEPGPVLFFRCLVQENASVRVYTKCCGMEPISETPLGERCKHSPNAPAGLNVVYVRPEMNTNNNVTVYIENFNLTSSRTILIQCIVEQKAIPRNESTPGKFSTTIRYMYEPSSSAQGLLMRAELLFLIATFSLFFLAQ